ncbi:MAG TPA: sensor domain-containing diguanylate cyclase [Gammaproteobacteria bacterium]|nr:sensor domain-containing diguanylate cyclase [Gammaproteobacteria bacterium]
MFLKRIPSLITTTVKYRDPGAKRLIGIRPLIAFVYLTIAATTLALSAPATVPSLPMLGGLLFFALWMVLLLVLPVPARALSSGGQGYTSFDRLAMVASILVFGAVPAAWVAGSAALVWTLIADPRREPLLQRLMRTAANAGMFALAALIAGQVYSWLGGLSPLEAFGFVDLGRVLILLLVLQTVNELLFLLMVWPSLNKRERRHPFSWLSILTEMAISLTGIITALAYTRMPLLGFALYVTFIMVVAILFKWVAEVAEARRLRAEEFAAVNRINQAVSAAIDLDELIETVFHEVHDLVHSAAFLLGVYDKDTNQLDIRLNYDEGIRHSRSKRDLGQGILAWSLQHREAIFIPDVRKSQHPAIKQIITHGREPVSAIVVPIIYKNEPVGALSVQDYVPDAFTQHQLRLLQGFALQIAVAITNTRLFDELKRQQLLLEARVDDRTSELQKMTESLAEAIEQKQELLNQLERENRRDTLTTIANRRHLDEFLPREMERARRYGHPLTIAMLDIDHFKAVNDNLGHAMGDRVLYTLANILVRELRTTDFAARYGGEEFIIVFPETVVKDAISACDKLRTLIALHPWPRLAENLNVTVSFGVASMAHPDQTTAQLLAGADRALYQAKSSGRNRVCEARLDEPNTESVT